MCNVVILCAVSGDFCVGRVCGADLGTCHFHWLSPAAPHSLPGTFLAGCLWSLGLYGGGGRPLEGREVGEGTLLPFRTP